MTPRDKHSFRTTLDKLAKEFSAAFASYHHNLMRHDDTDTPRTDAQRMRVEGAKLKAGFFAVLFLITVFTDHYFGYEVISTLFHNASQVALVLAAIAAALMLTIFSCLFVAYHEQLKEEESHIPGSVSILKMRLVGLAKFGVPLLFYGFVCISKITLVWELPGVDNMYKFNQISGMLGMLVIGTLSHLSLIVAGPAVFPALMPALDKFFADRKKKKELNQKKLLQYSKQALDNSLRNLLITHQRAIEAHPAEKEYFRLHLTADERTYVHQMYQP